MCLLFLSFIIYSNFQRGRTTYLIETTSIESRSDHLRSNDALPLCDQRSPPKCQRIHVYSPYQFYQIITVLPFASPQKSIQLMIYYICVLSLSNSSAYLIVDTETNEGAVVDPAAPSEVLSAVNHEGIRLTSVLTTHHHWDHAGGNEGQLLICSVSCVRGRVFGVFVACCVCGVVRGVLCVYRVYGVRCCVAWYVDAQVE